MTQQQDELDAIKAQIQDHLILSGTYDIVSKQLKLQLYENGWFDQVSQVASRELEESDDIKFERLFSFLKPKAEELVPTSVKEDIIDKLKVYLEDVIQ